MADSTTPDTLLAIGKKSTAPDHPVRFSYLKVFKAEVGKKAEAGEKPKFSVQVIIPKKSPDVPRIHAAMKVAHTAKGSPIKDEDYDTLDLILRDGDNPKENKKKEPHLFGHFFMNVSCGEKYPPDVVGTSIDPETQKLRRLTEKDIKSGDYGAVTVNFYPYDQKGNKGIAAGLRNIQLRKSGESLAGISNADDDFEADDDDDFMK